MKTFFELRETVQEAALDESFRTLATKGMGAEGKKDIKVGTGVDFYEPKVGNKRQGTITKMSSTGYEVKDDDGKTYKFNYYDNKKAKGLMKEAVESKQDAVELIRKKKQMAAISTSDKDKLSKIADMMRRANEDINEAPRRKGAPKIKDDFFKAQRAKDNAHDNAMGRTNTGRKKPVRTMTSTQRSMASMRREEVEQIDELTAAELKLINQMYDKKGNLTPMGKKVMDHGKAK